MGISLLQIRAEQLLSTFGDRPTLQEFSQCAGELMAETNEDVWLEFKNADETPKFLGRSNAPIELRAVFVDNKKGILTFYVVGQNTVRISIKWGRILAQRLKLPVEKVNFAWMDGDTDGYIYKTT